MRYTYVQASLTLSSYWRCAVRTVDGEWEWFIVAAPTHDGRIVDFPVKLPADAKINRAWLSMTTYNPYTGAEYATVNNINIPGSGDVEIEITEGIDAFTTTWQAIFEFKARGTVVRSRNNVYSSYPITNPTLNIEYTSEIENPGDDSGGETINRDPNAGAQLPRLLDNNLREIARIQPSKLELEMKLTPLSQATMDVPPGQPEIPVRAYVELFSPHGSVGIFRVREVETTRGYNAGQRVYLDQALTTLSDSLSIGILAMQAPVAQVLQTLLNNQTDKRWILGDCEVPEDYELLYEYSYSNVLESVTEIISMLPEEYALELDTLSYPWVMHVRKMPDVPTSECRLHRNLESVVITMDAADMCTRLYPFGAGEKSDRINLQALTGAQYVDASTTGTWGIITRTITAEEVFDAPTLLIVAEKYLEKRKNPLISLEISGVDMLEATGEAMDKFVLGHLCQLPLPAYGIVETERIVSIKWPDVYGDPQNVRLTLANRLRDASDELAALMREANASKLIGGTVETETKSSTAHNITSAAPFVHTFGISGYGNVLSVKISYTCQLTAGGAVPCTIVVDGNQVSESDINGTDADIIRYLATDESGVPTVGDHWVRLSPQRGSTVTCSVSNTITIKTIAKE